MTLLSVSVLATVAAASIAIAKSAADAARVQAALVPVRVKKIPRVAGALATFAVTAFGTALLYTPT